jgi:hypothetical protein
MFPDRKISALSDNTIPLVNTHLWPLRRNSPQLPLIVLTHFLGVAPYQRQITLSQGKAEPAGNTPTWHWAAWTMAKYNKALVYTR